MERRRFGGGDFDGPRRSFAPVKVGDEVNVKIEAVGEKGDGVAKVKGFVIFVPNTREGDEVKIKITRVLRKVGFGEVLGKADAPISTEAPKKSESEEEAGEESEGSEEETTEESKEESESESKETTEEDTEDFGEEESEEEF
jgi:predicted RNA-binding protein with TRAM domain